MNINKYGLALWVWCTFLLICIVVDEPELTTACVIGEISVSLLIFIDPQKRK